MKHTATLIKTSRDKVDMSQWQLAKALGYSSPQFISNAERGISSFPAGKARQLCELLEIKLSRWFYVVSKDKRAQCENDILEYKKKVGGV